MHNTSIVFKKLMDIDQKEKTTCCERCIIAFNLMRTNHKTQTQQNQDILNTRNTLIIIIANTYKVSIMC